MLSWTLPQVDMPQEQFTQARLAGHIGLTGKDILWLAMVTMRGDLLNYLDFIFIGVTSPVQVLYSQNKEGLICGSTKSSGG